MFCTGKVPKESGTSTAVLVLEGSETIAPHFEKAFGLHIRSRHRKNGGAPKFAKPKTYVHVYPYCLFQNFPVVKETLDV